MSTTHYKPKYSNTVSSHTTHCIKYKHICMIQLELVDWEEIFQQIRVWCTFNPFIVYLFSSFAFFQQQKTFTLLSSASDAILQPHFHIYYQLPLRHTSFINSLLHTLHHNRPCPYMAHHCSAAHILLSTSIWAFPCLFHMVQISSYIDKATDLLLDLYAQVFTLPQSYQSSLMLTSTRLLKTTIMVSSQYNIMLCHYVFLLQPKNHHTFFTPFMVLVSYFSTFGFHLVYS